MIKAFKILKTAKSAGLTIPTNHIVSVENVFIFSKEVETFDEENVMTIVTKRFVNFGYATYDSEGGQKVSKNNSLPGTSHTEEITKAEASGSITSLINSKFKQAFLNKAYGSVNVADANN